MLTTTGFLKKSEAWNVSFLSPVHTYAVRPLGPRPALDTVSLVSAFRRPAELEARVRFFFSGNTAVEI